MSGGLAWFDEFAAQSDQLTHTSDQLIRQLRTQRQSDEVAAASSAAVRARVALRELQRLGLAAGTRRGLG